MQVGKKKINYLYNDYFIKLKDEITLIIFPTKEIKISMFKYTTLIIPESLVITMPSVEVQIFRKQQYEII